MREILVGGAVVGALFAVIVLIFATRRRGRGSTATGRVASPAEPTDLWGTVAELLRDRRKIEAIKVVRQATGLGLKEAKDAVEEFEVTGRVPGRPRPKADGVRPDVAEEARRLKRDGKMIYAIKHVREHTGLGLKEAKDIVDAL